MNEDLKRLKEAMSAFGGHLQDLQSEQGATTRELGSVVTTVGHLEKSVGALQKSVGELQNSVGDLKKSVKNLEARSVHSEAALTALGGTFASIDQILTGLLVESERVDIMEHDLTVLKTRVEQLEKRAS